jgi:hypothetical protein
MCGCGGKADITDARLPKAQGKNGGPALVPQSLEAPSSHSCVSGRVLRIPVTKEILGGAEINTLVGEVIAARVPQHVRVDVP